MVALMTAVGPSMGWLPESEVSMNLVCSSSAGVYVQLVQPSSESVSCCSSSGNSSPGLGVGQLAFLPASIALLVFGVNLAGLSVGLLE